MNDLYRIYDRLVAVMRAACADRFDNNLTISLTADTSPCTGETLAEVLYRVRGPPGNSGKQSYYQSYNLNVCWTYIGLQSMPGRYQSAVPASEKVERSADEIDAAFCGLRKRV